MKTRLTDSQFVALVIALIAFFLAVELGVAFARNLFRRANPAQQEPTETQEHHGR